MEGEAVAEEEKEINIEKKNWREKHMVKEIEIKLHKHV
jgi:hypothetical protein